MRRFIFLSALLAIFAFTSPLAALPRGAGDSFEKDVCSERNHPAQCVRAHRAAQLPDPAKDYAAYAAFTGYQFVCDDQPYSEGCADKAERDRLIRFFIRDGGYSRKSAEEVVNWPLDRLMRQIAAVKRCGPEDVAGDTSPGPPRCNRAGYSSSAHAYLLPWPSCSEPFAQYVLRNSAHRVAPRDPYVEPFFTEDETLADAKQDRATWVVEACTDEAAAIHDQALAELIRVDQAYSRIRHPSARQTAAYLRKVERLSPLVCPNGMNDDDGEGNVGCD